MNRVYTLNDENKEHYTECAEETQSCTEKAEGFSVFLSVGLCASSVCSV
jgi:hypothetical protein